MLCFIFLYLYVDSTYTDHWHVKQVKKKVNDVLYTSEHYSVSFTVNKMRENVTKHQKD